MPGDLKVGFIHARDSHPQEGGIPRYGRILAEAVARQPGAEVQERSLEISRELGRDLKAAQDCGHALGGCDVIHAQFSRYTWGMGARGGNLLNAVQRASQAPVVVTFHDVQPEVYPASGRWKLFRECYYSVRELGFVWWYSVWRAIRLVGNGYLADRKTLRWLLGGAAQLIVSTDEEKARLRGFRGAEAIEVIPHFIERRDPVRTRQEARKDLGFGELKVVVLLGYCSPAKGHRVALGALQLLPENYRLVFAGGMARINDKDLADPNHFSHEWANERRLITTGFLSERDLETYILAADVAICPFTAISASGSLATWLSLGLAPIIASDFPQVTFYNEAAPGAITLVPPGDSTALAQAIQDCNGEATAAARVRLRELFSVDRIAGRHLEVYRKAQRRSGQHAASAVL